jgi:SnoaL-like domain
MRMRTAVASAAEPGLQVKADPMNSISRHTGWRRLLHGLSETVRVELTGEAGLAGKDTNPHHRSEASVANRKADSMTDSMTDNEIATNSHKLPEVPMNTHDELLLWHALHRLEVTYWYDVDFNEGRTAHEFFTPDGVKMVGHNRFEGREEIRAFYEWRARQTVAKAVRLLGISGVKAVRHLITNLFVASSSERCATVLGIVIFHGGLTYPSMRQSNPPMMVADLTNECVLNKDNVWRFKSHTLRPVFMSNATPPSMEIDPNFLKHT